MERFTENPRKGAKAVAFIFWYCLAVTLFAWWVML